MKRTDLNVLVDNEYKALNVLSPYKITQYDEENMFMTLPAYHKDRLMTIKLLPTEGSVTFLAYRINNGGAEAENRPLNETSNNICLAEDTFYLPKGHSLSIGPLVEGEIASLAVIVEHGYRQGIKGLGTEESPYLISSLDDLEELSNGYPVNDLRTDSSTCFWNSGKFIKQTANVDATETKLWNEGKGFSPIGNDPYPFCANYDGDGYCISNLYINTEGDTPDNPVQQGLFGYIESATIINVNLVNAFVGSGSEGAGLLIGLASSSTVSGCSVTGRMSAGVNNTGGLIGDCQNSEISACSADTHIYQIAEGYPRNIGGLIGSLAGGSLESCFATGRISASGAVNIGGLIGSAVDTAWIIDCYSHCSVTAGEDGIAGFIGYTDSVQLLSGCYSTGYSKAIGTEDIYGFIASVDILVIEDCHIDLETSGNTETLPEGVEGNTTGQMKAGQPFDEWDTDIWNFVPYQYPTLK